MNVGRVVVTFFHVTYAGSKMQSKVWKTKKSYRSNDPTKCGKALNVSF